MSESKCITLKQYRILLSFSLLLIFTTSSLPAFFSAAVQVILFCLIQLFFFSHIKNKRVCLGIFMVLAAAFGEGMYYLSEYLPASVSSGGFFLLPASTFLFLTVPMFDYFSEEKALSFSDIFRGILFYLPVGFIIATFREICGKGSVLGEHFDALDKVHVNFFEHTAGSALLVLFALVCLHAVKNDGLDKTWILDTSEQRMKKYRPISGKSEKRFLLLSICVLVYDTLFGVSGILFVHSVDERLLMPAHFVLLSVITTVVLLTPLVKIFRLSETMDKYFYVPLLCVITTSIPLVFYARYLEAPAHSISAERIVWWATLMVGVWFFTAIVIAYTRSIQGRLLFGKHPKCLEGIPLIVLHVLLTMIVFMPWTEVLEKF